MDPHTQRAEAERWLGIAAKLLTARDFLGSRTFAIRARDSDGNNDVSDQILAVVDTVLAGEKRVNSNQQPDWYSVLQLPRLVRDPELIADHYRRLVMCLNPDRNRLPFADYALQLVIDAWSVLSDPTKKWLFDNELALYLQQSESVAPPNTSSVAAAVAAGGSSVAVGVGVGGGSSGNQLNTFQFFQPQPPPPQQPPQQQQQPPMWQQQQQINQREFMPLPTQQQVPPQWQMRDPTPSKGGERNKGVMNGIGGITTSPMIPTQSTTRPVPRAPPQPKPSPPPPPPPPPPPVSATPLVDGNAGNASTFNNSNNNDSSNVVNGDASNANADADDGAAVNESNDEEVVEDVESFWTACPYCFYIFEYPKVYQDCTLRCQTCRRGFHAVQIPNPPPISSANNGRGDGGKEKEKENSFCCWGFFPLGFSMTAWRKQNKLGNLNGSSNWVPFSPMFTCPVQDGGGGFQWFNNSGGNAFVGPKYDEKKSAPRVYIDDDEDFLELSDPSDLDSSDGDWRTYNQEKSKSKSKSKSKNKKKKRRGKMGGPNKRGRPRRGDVLNKNVTIGGGVSVGGEHLDDDSDAQEVVVGLAAGDKSDASKRPPATLTRKQTRRSVKDVGRLDLNVEFNNDGEEHAPTVSAVNGEEDGIENIGFFEGLDEFLSTLPILNVGGDEKAKPS